MQNPLLHIEHVARLTHIQDRDTTDTVLVEVLRSLVRPASVTLLELVEVAGEHYCFTRAHLTSDMVAPISTPPWVRPEDCPPLTDFAERLACFQRRHTFRYFDENALVLIVPVVTDAESHLLIEVRMPHDGPDDIQSFAEGMAQPLVEGMAKIFRNFLNLLDCSERDTLTSLLNRKSFDDTFFKATRRVEPSEASAHQLQASDHRQSALPSQCWLGVIDIDHFKRVNDGFGHLIGDEVLLLVARIMRSSFRHDDRLYRFGGEEFVVLLHAHDEEGALAVFERFRRNVQSYEFPQVGRITVSIGFTRMRYNDTPSAAFERADKVVYMAKENGRNQVRCYEQQPEFADSQTQGASSEIELF